MIELLLVLAFLGLYNAFKSRGEAPSPEVLEQVRLEATGKGKRN